MPLGWIGKGAAQTGLPNTYERCLRLPSNGHASQRTVSKRQMFLTESRFLKREEELSTRRKIPKSGWDRHKLNPRAIAEEGGVHVECNANLTTRGIEQRDTRIVANPYINSAQQDLTSVIKKEAVFFFEQVV